MSETNQDNRASVDRVVMPPGLVNDLTAVYADLRRWQACLPSTGNIVVRQKFGKVCSYIDDLFEELDEEVEFYARQQKPVA